MMRLYCEVFEGQVGECVVFDGMDYNHVVNVMRHRLGDMLSIFNPFVGEWSACVRAINKYSFECVLVHLIRSPLILGRSVHLAVSRLKPDAWGWMLEKVTELGITHIHPLITERVQFAKNWQADKWYSLIKGAAQQCERLDVPALSSPQTLEAFLKGLDSSVQWFAAVERCDTSLWKAADHYHVGVIVGPEGGFSEHEKNMILAHQKVQSVSLGSNILRAETAAIVGATLLIY